MNKQLNDQMAELDNMTVAVSGSMSWTRRELNDLFKRVEPAGNWKLRIDAVAVAADDRELLGIREAVIFFTGSVPTMTPKGRNRYHVKAAGYYAAIGA